MGTRHGELAVQNFQFHEKAMRKKPSRAGLVHGRVANLGRAIKPQASFGLCGGAGQENFLQLVVFLGRQLSKLSGAEG